VALPINLKICLSMMASDSGEPLVYKVWPNEDMKWLSVEGTRGEGMRTLERRVRLTIVRSEICEGTCEDGHGMCVISVIPG